MVALVVMVIGGGVGGFFAWKHFLAQPPPEAAKPVPKPKPATPAATATTEPPAPAPASTADETEPTPAVPKPRAPVKVVLDPAPRTPQPVSAEASGVAPTPLAPGVTATVAPAMTTADASPAFRAFVANVKITGVFQGNPARAMINGRTFREGDYVDTSLGVIFDSVDIQKKQIVFRDRSDVTIRRKY